MMKRRILTILFLSLSMSAITIHLDYRPLFRLFKSIRKEFNILTGRPIIYMEWDKKLNLPLMNYGKINGIFIGKQANPLQISQVLLEQILPKDTTLFLRLARRLVEFFPEDGLYRYPFPDFLYKWEKNWVSAFTQAAAGEVFSRAWRISGDSIFLEMSYKVLKHLLVPVDRGGTCYLQDGRIWFEEYAHPGGPYPRVLNGMIWVLLHLKHIGEILKDTLFTDLYHRGELTLRDSLKNYDISGWTTYDRLGRVSGETYQIMHVDLMDSLYRLTGYEGYRSWRSRWMWGFHFPWRARIAWGWFFVHTVLFFALGILLSWWRNSL